MQILTAEWNIPNLCVDSLILQVIHEMDFMDSSFTCTASLIMNFSVQNQCNEWCVWYWNVCLLVLNFIGVMSQNWNILNLLQNTYDNFVWHFMLNHSSLDFHMLKSTHLKHLNHLNFVLWCLCTVCVYRDFVLWCLCTVCVYRERHLIASLQIENLLIGSQVMIPPSSQKNVKIVWITFSQFLFIIGLWNNGFYHGHMIKQNNLWLSVDACHINASKLVLSWHWNKCIYIIVSL